MLQIENIWYAKEIIGYNPLSIIALKSQRPRLPIQRKREHIIHDKNKIALLKYVVKGVADYYRISHEKMYIIRGMQNNCHARHMAYYILMNDLYFKSTWLASYFNMNHTSILYGKKKIKNLLTHKKVDVKEKNEYAEITKYLNIKTNG